MTILLNHTIVPARDKEASARFFAQLFGLRFEGQDGHFAPVRVNETFTLLFDDDIKAFESHHYAFHVSDAEFDAILQRVQAAGLAFSAKLWRRRTPRLGFHCGGASYLHLHFSVAGAKQLLKKLPIKEFPGLVSVSSRYYAERRWRLRRRYRLRQEPRPFRVRV